MDLNRIARKRVETLLSLAKEMWEKDKTLSKRYVQLARKIGMRHQLKLGNKRFCKKCDTIFIPGKTV
ncbi:ribonuclease P, partial [Candidatus Micrarchaeota archaeon]|nr:ribonuclease P [Candidatus Micrarchaeota archaeon]